MAATIGTAELTGSFICNIGIVLRVAVRTDSMTSAVSEEIAFDLFRGLTTSPITARFDHVDVIKSVLLKGNIHADQLVGFVLPCSMR